MLPFLGTNRHFLEISCEWSTAVHWQMSHMKCRALVSLKMYKDITKLSSAAVVFGA